MPTPASVLLSLIMAASAWMMPALIVGCGLASAPARATPAGADATHRVDWLAVAKQQGSEGVIEMLEAKLAELTEYEVWMRRQERLPSGWNEQAFVNYIKYRHAPRQVYMAWQAGGPKAGQEILFDETKRRDAMYGHLSGLLGVASVWTPLDGPLARANSRHHVRDAGLHAVVAILRAQLDKHKDARGWPDPAQVELTRQGAAPTVALTWVVVSPPPSGGTYAHKTRIGLIPEQPWIKSVESWDENGRPLERIVFDRVEPARFSELDFSPSNPAYRF